MTELGTMAGRDLAAYLSGDLMGAVVMINLIQLNPTTARGESGAAVYDRYVAAVGPMIEAVGGSILFTGSARFILAGSADDNPWDVVAIVSYPSRQAFIGLLTSPAYQAISGDREEATQLSTVIACETKGAG